MHITISDRLFSKVGRYFGSVDEALREALQNAYRSYCPIAENDNADRRIVIDTVGDKDCVVIRDFGRGIDSPEKMLSLASSDWANDVEHDQDPAGLGVCALLAYAETVTWESTFGSVTVDGARFFADPMYRADLCCEHAIPLDGGGTRVTMRGIKLPSSYYKNVAERLVGLSRNFTRVSIWINGAKCGTVLGYATPVVTIPGARIYYIHGVHSMDRPCVLWHGHLIPVVEVGLPLPVVDRVVTYDGKDYTLSVTSYSNVIIEVLGENCVTPKLPARDVLIHDERTSAFLAACAAAYGNAVIDQAIAACAHARLPSSVVTKEQWGRWTDPGKYRHHQAVNGTNTLWRHTSGWMAVSTCVLDSVYNRALRTEYEVCRRGSVAGIVDRMDVLVLTPSGLETYSAASEAGGIIFGDAGEEDPVWAEGYAWGDTEEITHSLCFVATTPGHGVCHAGTRVWKTDEWEVKIVPRGATIEDIRATAPLEWTGGGAYLVDEDPDSDNACYRGALCFGDQDTYAKGLSAMGGIYTDLHSGHLDYTGDYDDPESLKDEYRASWAEAVASLNGELYLGMDLRSLKYKLAGATTFTVDLDADTITTAAGVVHKVVWR